MRIEDIAQKLPLNILRRRRPTISVVPLVGAIGVMGRMRGGLNLASVASRLERAFSLKGVKAVALAINSPGGSPVQAALIANRIRSLAADKKLPVYAFAEDVAASGGYILALAGDDIYADESSIVGSIGVISSGFGFDQVLDRIGVERRIYTSGDKKGMLDPFKPESPQDVARLKALQKEIHRNFKNLVRERRGTRLKGTTRKLFSGEFWTAGPALELGLIDGIGDLRSVMREEFGDKVRFRHFGAQRSWLRTRLRLGEMLAGEQAPGAWADDLLAALEARALWTRFGL